MRISVVCGRESRGADALCQALMDQGHEAGVYLPDATKRIRWGRHLGTKAQELETLRAAGVSVPESFLESALPRGAKIYGRPRVTRPDEQTWLRRAADHSQARDLRNPRRTVAQAFYTRWEPLVDEYRCHVWANHRHAGQFVVVRSAHKRPDPNAATTHPWIRSRKSGWILSYDQVQTSEAVRDMSKRALAAFAQGDEAARLSFGAVDIGVRADGSPVVLEINTAPGLDNPNTARVYAERAVLLFQTKDVI